MTKRIMSLALALIMIMACACGAFAETVEIPVCEYTSEMNTYTYWEPEWPIVKEGEKLTVTVASAVRSDSYKVPEETWFWVWSELATGIDFDVRQITYEAREEQKNLMFASDNLPDVLLAMSLSTGDIMRYGVAEGQLLDLAPYITEETMPYLYQWFEKYPVMKATATTPDGAIYSLPFTNLNSDYIGSQETNSYNQDWLREVYPELPAQHTTREEFYAWSEAAGKVLPKTVDEFVELLRAFKKNHPDSTPLAGVADENNPLSYILNAYGFLTESNNDYGAQVAIKDGEVVLPALHEDFFPFLQTVKTLYDEGLIASDFFTADKLLVDSQIMDNKSGVIAAGSIYGRLPLPEDYHKWDALWPLTSEYSETMQVKESSRYNVGGACLSAKLEGQDEKIKAILNYLDFFYSELGCYYLWCGPINGSPDTLGMVRGFFYDLEKGAKVFPDVISGEYENSIKFVCGIGFGNSSAFGNRSHSITDEKYSTMMILLQHLQGVPDEEINFVALAYDHGDNYGRMCSEVRVLPSVVEGYPKIVYYSEDDQETIDEVILMLDPYIESEVAKFITGATELTEENFKKFVDGAEVYGASDLIEIYQAAWEAYKAAL